MSTLVEQLREKRSALITQATEIAQTSVAEGRNLTAEEQTSFDQIIADAEGLGQRAADRRPEVGPLGAVVGHHPGRNTHHSTISAHDTIGSHHRQPGSTDRSTSTASG